MKLKVCGITQLEQLKQLDEIGVNYAGLIFYKQSARCVINKLNAEDVRPLELALKKIGVFVNADEEYIMNQVEDFALDIVQLHGDETPGFCKTISDRITVIKAFRITQSNEQNIDWMIKPYEEYCDYYLFDTNRKNAYGGTGEKFDWKILQQNKINKPFFLSGGITLNDVEKLKAFDHPFFYCVDVNSRMEISEGVKDMQAVKTMAEELLEKNS
ncbi:phosphoribosylanthranilate isomerase [Ginsengibacter hankyongi]|uniref:N-(5'-phosphoribosyl)anthranilate isomerase n=1 Tax=Ginsengibacter hankyongi TaxID=2607284 RepID=A0A5J5IJQ7_9BACT|nr:phosphoribosylanthranilate isomerase [Ginsengibacter hankyongi]KAA9041279.1 phosphoribosylanthranilate isomerase [Ginsengibacter hankyongi]